MASGVRFGSLEEIDLHALVDGQVDDDRRVTLQHRLAGSPMDRVRVEAWQGQNELLRATFASIEREPLPAMLDLSPKARLQCVPANDAPLVEPASIVETKSARRVRIAAVIATIFVVTAGLGGSWLLLDAPSPEAGQTSIALSPTSVVQESAIRLPTTRIPDLGALGFRFVAAETATNPVAVLFHYRSGSEQIVVSASHASTRAETTSVPKWTGNGFGWRRDDALFAVTGTAKRDRLQAIAVALQQRQAARD